MHIYFWVLTFKGFSNTWMCWSGGKGELKRFNQGWCSRDSSFMQETGDKKSKYLPRIGDIRSLLFVIAQDVQSILTHLPSFFFQRLA